MKLTKLALLIVIIITLGLGVIVVSRYNPSFRMPIQVSTTPKPSPLEIVRAQMSLTPQITELHVGDKSSFDVSVDPGDKKVIGVETAFIYDPKTIKVTSITTGTYFQKADIFNQQIDPATGKIFFAVAATLGTPVPAPGRGILFSINFVAVKPTVGVGNIINFNQAETRIGLENIHNQVFAAKQTTLVFDEKSVSVLP